MSEKRDLFLLIGQSNMAGRGPLDGFAPLHDPRITLFRDGQWLTAQEPLHTDKPEIVGAGLAMSFATTLLSESAGQGIGLIPCAFGGTPLSRWIPGGDLYRNAVSTAHAAMSAGTLCGILWHQGEADSHKLEDATTYGKRLQETIRGLREELPAHDIPFVAGELGSFLEHHDGCDYFAIVNQQLNELAETLSDYGCASAQGLTDKGDTIHFDTPSLRQFGVRYAESYRALAESNDGGQ